MVLFVFLVACGLPSSPRAQGLPARVTGRVAVGQLATEDEGKATLSTCDSFRKVAERSLRAVQQPDGQRAAFDPQDPVSGRCMVAKGGTWSLVPTTLSVPAETVSRGDRIGTLTIFHTTPAGIQTSVVPELVPGPSGNYTCVLGDVCGELSEPLVFDFDGDGSDEFVVYGHGHRHEGESFSFGGVWSIRGGAVVPYAPLVGVRFEDVRDVNGDGRPDFLVHGGFDAVVESPCSGFNYRLTGPLFVLSAQVDGSFAGKDTASRDHAYKSCPAAPKKLVVHNEAKIVDEEATALNLVCARVWGRDPRDLRRELKRSCRVSNARDACTPAPGSCEQLQTYLAWAALTPPVMLTR
jgi:hypothetical protein